LSITDKNHRNVVTLGWTVWDTGQWSLSAPPSVRVRTTFLPFRLHFYVVYNSYNKDVVLPNGDALISVI